MGIVLDIIIVIIIGLSTFLGYKKGLVELAVKLFAGIIAIILTVILYKPVSNFVMLNTPIDEKIENIISERTIKSIENNVNEKGYLQYATNGITDEMNRQIKNVTKNIIYAITALIIFIASKIVLSIIIALANFVAKLPILKQFNEVGGLCYGVLRGLLIVCIGIILIKIFISFNPTSKIKNSIEESYLTRTIYEIIGYNSQLLN